MTNPVTRADALGAAAAFLLSAVVPQSWRDEIAHKVAADARKGILDTAADKLDEQAAAHRESIIDYTDLLRVWAEDPRRWEGGC